MNEWIIAELIGFVVGMAFGYCLGYIDGIKRPDPSDSEDPPEVSDD